MVALERRHKDLGDGGYKWLGLPYYLLRNFVVPSLRRLTHSYTNESVTFQHYTENPHHKYLLLTHLIYFRIIISFVQTRLTPEKLQLYLYILQMKLFPHGEYIEDPELSPTEQDNLNATCRSEARTELLRFIRTFFKNLFLKALIYLFSQTHPFFDVEGSGFEFG